MTISNINLVPKDNDYSYEKEKENISIPVHHFLGRKFEIIKPEEGHFHRCHCQIIPDFLHKKIIKLLKNQNLLEEHVFDGHLNKNSSLRKLREHELSRHHEEKNLIEFQENLQEGSESLSDLTQTQIQSMQKIKININTAKNQYSYGLLEVGVQSYSGLPGYVQTKSTTDPFALTALQQVQKVAEFLIKELNHTSFNGNDNSPFQVVVHFGNKYGNAFWDGRFLVFGDGDGAILQSFSDFIDVVAHEIGHAVTENSPNPLNYSGESGALNEHLSDVLGIWTKFYLQKDPPETEDWVLAYGLIKDKKGNEYPLRSFASPGNAYNTPELGKDPQRSKYSNRYKGTGDNGGVHINSGIPNHAFYLFYTKLLAANIAPHEALKLAGQIWWQTTRKTGAYGPSATFSQFANAIIVTAKSLTNNNLTIVNALRAAWKEVEVVTNQILEGEEESIINQEEEIIRAPKPEEQVFELLV